MAQRGHHTPTSRTRRGSSHHCEQSGHGQTRRRPHEEILVLRRFDWVMNWTTIGRKVLFRIDEDDLEAASARPHLDQTPVGVYANDQERTSARVVLDLRIVAFVVVPTQRDLRQTEIGALAIEIIRNDRPDQSTAVP